MTAPAAGHQDGGDKYVTGKTKPKLRGRQNITIGTWNVRTLRPDGKLEELTHEMARYTWHVLGLSEMRWKFHGEISTEDGHKVFFSGSEARHENGVGFLINKDIVGSVMGCRPVSERLITIRLRASPFNITIIQVYAPTTSHDDDEIEELYDQLQSLVDETPKKDILIVLGDWNAKVGEDAHADWQDVCGPYCNKESNDRGLRLLEFAAYNKLIITNTLGSHKASRRWTWHSPNGKVHNQIDYILVRKRFRSGVNIARTRSFPGADVGSDHNLLMTTYRVRLKKTRKPKQLRIKYDLEKLKDPKVAQAFEASIGGKFAPLICIGDSEWDLESMVNTFNTAFTETAADELGKQRRVKKPWVNKDVLDLCDKRRELKNKKGTREGAKQYRKMNNLVKKNMKLAKEKWVNERCEEVESNLKRNNSKKSLPTCERPNNREDRESHNHPGQRWQVPNRGA